MVPSPGDNRRLFGLNTAPRFGEEPAFKKKTLFVLGAGSSYEVKLPVGLGLAKTIATKLDVRIGDHGKNVGEGDKYLLGQFQNHHPQQFNDYLRAGWRIRDGLPTASSIDDFLDMHSHELMQTIGKAAIVRSIIEAERESDLYFDPNDRSKRLGLEKLEGSWFMRFVRVLGRGISKNNAPQIFDNVSFVVFNYDRCVEFFLLQALQAMYSLPLNDAASIVQDLSIIHPASFLILATAPRSRSAALRTTTSTTSSSRSELEHTQSSSLARK